MYKSLQPNLWSSKKGRFKDAHSRLIVNHRDPCSCGGQLRATCGQRLSDVSKYAHSTPPIPHHTSIPIIPIPTHNTFNTPTPPSTNTGHTSIPIPPSNMAHKEATAQLHHCPSPNLILTSPAGSRNEDKTLGWPKGLETTKSQRLDDFPNILEDVLMKSLTV